MDGPVKVCRACGEARPLTLFYRHRAMSDGLANECKDCARERSRAYRKAHPEVRKRWRERWKDLERDVAEHLARVERLARQG